MGFSYKRNFISLNFDLIMSYKQVHLHTRCGTCIRGRGWMQHLLGGPPGEVGWGWVLWRLPSLRGWGWITWGGSPRHLYLALPTQTGG